MAMSKISFGLIARIRLKNGEVNFFSIFRLTIGIEIQITNLNPTQLSNGASDFFLGGMGP